MNNKLKDSLKCLELSEMPKTVDELKKQFRKLSILYHPDTNPEADRYKMGELIESKDYLLSQFGVNKNKHIIVDTEESFEYQVFKSELINHKDKVEYKESIHLINSLLNEISNTKYYSYNYDQLLEVIKPLASSIILESLNTLTKEFVVPDNYCKNITEDILLSKDYGIYPIINNLEITLYTLYTKIENINNFIERPITIEHNFFINYIFTYFDFCINLIDKTKFNFVKSSLFENLVNNLYINKINESKKYMLDVNSMLFDLIITEDILNRQEEIINEIAYQIKDHYVLLDSLNNAVLSSLEPNKAKSVILDLLTRFFSNDISVVTDGEEMPAVFTDNVFFKEISIINFEKLCSLDESYYKFKLPDNVVNSKAWHDITLTHILYNYLYISYYDDNSIIETIDSNICSIINMYVSDKVLQTCPDIDLTQMEEHGLEDVAEIINVFNKEIDNYLAKGYSR
ncbi:MAG: hypothetical protein R3Y13_02150 [bacterium]